MGVEYTKEFIEQASMVIAEVSPHVPWTEGPSKIPIHKIDWWTPNEELLLTTQQLWPQFAKGPLYPKHVSDGIGRNVAKHIPDGATLKFNLSIWTFAVFPFLSDKHDLGIHTDVFPEPLYKLQLDGVINNSQKNNEDRGVTVTSMAHGSQELYSFLDRNPAIEIHGLQYLNDPNVMGNIDNFIFVLGALKVDLTGQVASDSIAAKTYGGVWSDTDGVSLNYSRRVFVKDADFKKI
jgi:4-hydroxybutyrate CoA-transferase